MSRWKLRLAANTVRNGGVIAYPTEAVYGLGCDPWNESAVFSLLSLKKRSVNKGLILIASNLQQLVPFIGDLDSSIKNRVLPTWPGPVTWLIPPSLGCPSFLYGQHNTVAVRVTNHPLVVALCNQLDSALVSTSANVQGQTAAKTSFRVHKIFGNQLDYILTGETGGQLSPSKICDVRTGAIVRNAIGR